MQLIQQIRLPNGRPTSNLGFGCSSLMRLPGAGDRNRLLQTAVDVGITHFDVARMYGLGAAEGVVGNALHAIRDHVTLATKFGLPCAVPNPLKVKLQSAARWILKMQPGLKSLLKRKVTSALAVAQDNVHHCDYSVAEMRQSLQVSLVQLKTDRVDLFFLHEPWARDAIPQDLVPALLEQQQKGVIGSFGVSGYSSELPILLQKYPELTAHALQHDYSCLRGSSLPIKPGTLTGLFGVVQEAHSQVVALLERDRAFAKEWSGKLDLDLTQPENAGIVILAIALALNTKSIVLFSTTDAQRLRRTVSRLRENSFTGALLLEFRHAMTHRLPAHAH